MKWIEKLFDVDVDDLKKVEQETKCFYDKTANNGDFEKFVRGTIEVSEDERELWRGMVFAHLLEPYVRGEVNKNEKRE